MNNKYEQSEISSRENYTIDDYWLVLYRRKRIIVFIVLAAIIFTVVISHLITPKYEARSIFYVPQDVKFSGDILGQEAGKARMPAGSQEDAKAYVAILKGNDAKRKIHERFPKKPLGELNRDVDFLVLREGTITIFVRDKNPVLAADIANSFVDYFNQFIKEIAENDLNDSLERIGEEIKKVESQLDEAINAKQLFQEKYNISSLQTELGELERHRINFQERLQSAMVELQAIDNQISSLNQQLTIESGIYQDEKAILTNRVIESLQETIAQLEVDLAGKTSELQPEHPDVIALKQRYAKAEENLKKEIVRVVESKSKFPESLYEDLRKRLTILHVDKKGTEARIQALNEVIDGINKNIGEIPGIIAKSVYYEDEVTHYLNIKRTLEKTQDNLKSGSFQFKKAGIMIETAHPPRSPVFPVLWLNILSSGLFSLIIGIIYAFFLEYLEDRRRIRKLKEVKFKEWVKAL